MKRGRRVLGDEEMRLWASVARTALPLPGRLAPVFDVPAPAVLAAPADRSPTATDRAAVPALREPARAVKPSLPSLHPIERPVRRKLAKGRLDIEDRIDLHDKTESLAHHALLAFLRHARASGFRHVLVITGRGSSPGSRGALRRALPHWFDTPDFRVLVAGFEPAARGHGGEGAFYVRVRRR